MCADTARDARWMRVALGLGMRGLGRVWPNPAVGCVLVRNERVVGRGWTAPGGRPHAETQALAQAGAEARGATAYVTLEPCAHHGKTGPCTQALIDAGIVRVVYALTDPDRRVAGRGAAELKTAGLSVTGGVMEDAARQAHAGFLCRITEKRPFLTLKLASSLDGRIATASGESQWITGTEARRRVHMMRARFDAILVGAGTVRADNPRLNVRDIGVSTQPIRLVISSDLNIQPSCNLGQGASDGQLWLLHCQDRADERYKMWQKTGARLIALPRSGGGVDLSAAMAALAEAGLTRVFCEGGGRLAAGLINAGLVDQLALFTAGKVIGGDGHPSIGALGVSVLDDVPKFSLRSAEPVGEDYLQIWDRVGAFETS